MSSSSSGSSTPLTTCITTCKARCSRSLGRPCWSLEGIASKELIHSTGEGEGDSLPCTASCCPLELDHYTLVSNALLRPAHGRALHTIRLWVASRCNTVLCLPKKTDQHPLLCCCLCTPEPANTCDLFHTPNRVPASHLSCLNVRHQHSRGLVRVSACDGDLGQEVQVGPVAGASGNTGEHGTSQGMEAVLPGPPPALIPKGRFGDNAGQK